MLAALLTLLCALLAAPAVAVPGGGAYIAGIERVSDRWDKVSVFSPAMNKVIINDVYKAPGGGAPTLYL
ncbi:MAG: esterase family protein, partial [Mycobacterium sp.]|nr:esterase family protein [Mycobacterium sp.]